MLRSVKTLEDNIVQIEKHYDDLNVAFAQCDTSDHICSFQSFEVGWVKINVDRFWVSECS